MTSRFAAGALCGIAAGIVTGMAARIAMRMVADGVPDGIGQRPDFTLLGTLAIVGAGAVAGAGVGVACELTHDGLPGPRRLRGLVFAVVLLALIGPLFFLSAAAEFITTQRVILFSMLFPIYGLAAGNALPVSRRLAARLDRRAQILLALVGLGSASLVGAALPGLAQQAIELHGATAIGFAIPWVVVACALLGRRTTRAAFPRRHGVRA